MILETQAQFARRLHKDRAHVTRLKQAGRLVLAADGRVDVEASLARIDATRGARFDVEARFAAQRAESLPLELPAPDTAPESAQDPTAIRIDLDEIGRRTRHAQMLEREAVARIREREEQEQAGLLIRRAAVVKAASDAVAIILNAAETLPDRVAPLLLNLNDPVRIRALLRDEVEQLLATVSQQLDVIATTGHPHA